MTEAESMTEAEWLACEDPLRMFEVAHGKTGKKVGLRTNDRRLRLFAVACCRVFWDRLNIDATRAAIETCERFADFQATYEELGDACNAVRRGDLTDESVRRMTFVASVACDYDRLCAWLRTTLLCQDVLKHHSRSLLRDIYGNYFRPATPEPAWLTSTVTALAKGMYDTRDFLPMPILADALQDAGCDNDDILNHCRNPNQAHVRGCWVVDLVLGKE